MFASFSLKQLARHRSFLPIFTTLASLAGGLGAAGDALALDHLPLDPVTVECRTASLPGGAERCDVYSSGLQVHEGREMSPAVANGDCVKCRTVVSRAARLGRNVILLRGYKGSELADWGMDEFFTVEGEVDGGQCRPN